MSIKEAKLQYIVDGATALFLEKGIGDVTVRDIAVATGVGEATVYRYFAKKQNIVVASAMKLGGEVLEGYFRLKGESGLERLTDFYTVFLRIFEERPDLYKFISEFDAYIAGEKGDLTEYEKALFPFYKNFSDAYDAGIEDGTVKPVADPSLFYLTTTHALLGLCKKMASENILEQDRNGRDEIKLLVSIIVNNLKK